MDTARAIPKGYGSIWGRGFALISRFLILLLVAYIIFHKAGPGDMLDKPLGQLTFNELFSIVFKLLISLGIGGFFFIKAFNPPDLIDRDQQWCEAWQSAGFLLPLFFAAMVFFLFYPPEKEPWKEIFQWVFGTTVWLLF
jgi:hypothetical protein